jgi:hypothetical protein
MMAGEICSACRFWRRLEQDADEFGFARDYEVPDGSTGVCRRYPPSTRRADIDHASSHSWDAARGAYWPVTWDDDWCGEFDAAMKVVA